MHTRRLIKQNSFILFFVDKKFQMQRYDQSQYQLNFSLLFQEGLFTLCKCLSYKKQNIVYSQYLQISMSQMHRLKQQPKPSGARIMAIRRQRRSLTEQHSIESSQSQVTSERNNLLFPKMQKIADVPSIFTSHKRSQYCGYKQISLNKSKAIQFQQETRQANRYQTPRNFEVNTKNIAKLRKRFSLEPIQVKDIRVEHQRMFMATSKSLQKESDSKIKNSRTERHYHKQLRQMLRLMNLHQHTSSGKNIPNEVKSTDSLEQTPQNLSHITSQSPDEKCDQLSEVGEKIQQLPQKTVGFNKPYYVQIKKRVQNKIHNGNQKKILPSIGKVVHNDQQQALCGWTAKSFYPKNRSNFFENSNEEKLRLIQGQI